MKKSIRIIQLLAISITVAFVFVISKLYIADSTAKKIDYDHSIVHMTKGIPMFWIVKLF